MSRVEGNFSRVKGKMSRVKKNGIDLFIIFFYYFVSSCAYLFFSFLRRGSRINTDHFPKRECKLLGGPGYAPLPKVPFPGFPSHSRTGHWPVPLSSGEAMQIGGLFLDQG